MHKCAKMKRSRSGRDRLPIRYRCKDKYNRALEAEMQRFIESESESSEETAADKSNHWILLQGVFGMPILLASTRVCFYIAHGVLDFWVKIMRIHCRHTVSCNSK